MTREVLKRLGLTNAGLWQLLTKYPHLKPAKQFYHPGNQGYVWTEAELQEVERHRATHLDAAPTKECPDDDP